MESLQGLSVFGMLVCNHQKLCDSELIFSTGTSKNSKWKYRESPKLAKYRCVGLIITATAVEPDRSFSPWISGSSRISESSAKNPARSPLRTSSTTWKVKKFESTARAKYTLWQTENYLSLIKINARVAYRGVWRVASLVFINNSLELGSQEVRVILYDHWVIIRVLIVLEYMLK